MCEDLFTKINDNTDNSMSYSVEVSSAVRVVCLSCDCFKANSMNMNRWATWKSTVNVFGTCWTPKTKGTCVYENTLWWDPTWRTCPSWLLPPTMTSRTWWTLATKLGDGDHSASSCTFKETSSSLQEHWGKQTADKNVFTVSAGLWLPPTWMRQAVALTLSSTSYSLRNVTTLTPTTPLRR